MKYQSLPISSAYRRFLALAGKLRRLLRSGAYYQLSAVRRAALATRLKQLYLRLSAVFSERRLRRVLASATVLLGLSSVSVQAQDFAPPQASPFGLQTVGYVPLPAAADLDNDGDQDLLVVTNNYYNQDSILAYYQNVGTPEAPAFAPPQYSPFGLVASPGPTTVDFVDIDDDGDLDLFYGTYDFDGLVADLLFFENTGTPENPQFASPVANPFGIQPVNEVQVPVFADLDGDGDFDLLGTRYNPSTEASDFSYQENIGSADAPSFTDPVVNPFGLDNGGFYTVIHTIGDLDDDGDLDLLVGGSPLGYGSSSVEFRENTGSPTAPAFAGPVENPFNISFPDNSYITVPDLVDLDNDGDLDLIVGAYLYFEEENKPVIWYLENLAVINSSQEAKPQVSFEAFPTVTKGSLNWRLSAAGASEKYVLRIIDAHGRQILLRQEELPAGSGQGQFDVSALPAGLYHLQLSTAEGRPLASRRFITD